MKRAVLCLLLFSFPVLSASQSDALIRRPEIRVGDSWTYRSTNLIGQGIYDQETRVSFVDDKVILLVTKRRSDGKEFDSSYTPEWNAVTGLSGTMYRPHSVSFRFPLRIGDKYEAKFETLRPRVDNIETVTKTASVVAGWEAVEVPAGIFRAMKIEWKGEIQVLNNSKTYPAQGAYWYVPEVRRWVKYQIEFTNGERRGEELLEYRLNEN